MTVKMVDVEVAGIDKGEHETSVFEKGDGELEAEWGKGEVISGIGEDIPGKTEKAGD